MMTQYRSITIMSCFGKLFTSILNARLNDVIYAHTVIEENQAGFHAGYSTMDYRYCKTQKQELLCLFIDFSRADATVWRVGLWKKF